MEFWRTIYDGKELIIRNKAETRRPGRKVITSNFQQDLHFISRSLRLYFGTDFSLINIFFAMKRLHGLNQIRNFHSTHLLYLNYFSRGAGSFSVTVCLSNRGGAILNCPFWDSFKQCKYAKSAKTSKSAAAEDSNLNETPARLK